MLNRRHLRIKVLQTLYAYFQSNEDNYGHSEKELMQSVERIYDLYIYLLLTFAELKEIAENRIEDSKKKIRPSEEETNPNLKFVNNAIIQKLEESKTLRAISEDRKVNWVGDEHREMFRKIYFQLREGETYFEFMNNGSQSFDEDLSFAIELFKIEIANSPILYNFFEEKSIHWMDDIDLACSMVIKTLKSIELEEPLYLLPLYKEDDDEQEFIRQLLRKTISMDKENEALIDDLTKNWELERIAKMDIILMKMALT
jgi:N utilization substance protein B